MRSLISITVICFSLYSLSAAAASEWPDAYGRRNYQLGMTLSEFRAARHPDQEAWPNAFPVCSDEPRAHKYPFSRSLPPRPMAEVGVIKCTHFYTDSDGLTPQTFDAGLILGDLPTFTEFYFFPPRQDAEPVLFMIETIGPTDRFDSVVSMFRHAFGAPSETRVETVQTGAGATLRNPIVIYRNNVSWIRIQRFGRTIQQLLIDHTLLPVLDRFDAALTARDKKNANKL